MIDGTYRFHTCRATLDKYVPSNSSVPKNACPRQRSVHTSLLQQIAHDGFPEAAEGRPRRAPAPCTCSCPDSRRKSKSTFLCFPTSQAASAAGTSHPPELLRCFGSQGRGQRIFMCLVDDCCIKQACDALMALVLRCSSSPQRHTASALPSQS